MERIRVAFIVSVDLDQVPGDMHTPETAASALRWILEGHISHYNPIVVLAPNTMQPLSNIEVRDAK